MVATTLLARPSPAAALRARRPRGVARAARVVAVRPAAGVGQYLSEAASQIFHPQVCCAWAVRGASERAAHTPPPLPNPTTLTPPPTPTPLPTRPTLTSTGRAPPRALLGRLCTTRRWPSEQAARERAALSPLHPLPPPTADRLLPPPPPPPPLSPTQAARGARGGERRPPAAGGLHGPFSHQLQPRRHRRGRQLRVPVRGCERGGEGGGREGGAQACVGIARGTGACWHFPGAGRCRSEAGIARGAASLRPSASAAPPQAAADAHPPPPPHPSLAAPHSFDDTGAFVGEEGSAGDYVRSVSGREGGV